MDKSYVGEEKVITIVVSGGIVQEVNNLPDGYLYEVVDYDLLDEEPTDLTL